ncbi:hypothetical protein SAMN06295912_105218 [Sphingomonas laterariae]|uniref:Uncharacterized protein n=1 Tax=Edaphosphingomonas laterariae TaxID=861865 RepID=A0A239E513_9SPHN|nr:hypothetical protein [Sphingomonas laterariae]SNS39805.1 hypothetical protein SAMN06295912_105218 [Sphingomonas laterariae]
MSAVEKSGNVAGVERLPSKPRSTAISDELRRITETLIAVCPQEAIVTFSYEGRLEVHIDVRNLEHVTLVEAILPTLGAGMFSNIQRGISPPHPFFHRVSADVEA